MKNSLNLILHAEKLANIYNDKYLSLGDNYIQEFSNIKEFTLFVHYFQLSFITLYSITIFRPGHPSF